ncbi:MAG: nucleotidyltransferase family protein [Butyricicoccus sp.]
MTVCGITAEYNPFHTGHLHHIAETRRSLGENAVIVCVMSGNFVQRGDFAVLDKYARAEMVRCGADLVVELPLAAALSSAEGFAKGAVQTLHALGCTVSFGAETADTDLLLQAAELLNSLPMKGESGSPHLSYAARRQKELSKVNKQAAVLLDNPNNTLAVEYCRFLLPLGMRPLAVLRQGAAHDARAPHSGFASASLLRAHLRHGDFAFCAPFLPPAARAVWKNAADCGEAPVALPEDTLLALLRTALYQGRLRTGSADGFDERLRKAVYTAHSFSDAVEKARTRRFPAARVRRALLRSVLGVETDAPVSPAYLRVLALGPRGRSVLKTASLPVIVKPATEKRLSDALQPALRHDAFADDLFALALPDPEQRIGGGHFRKTPFCLH